jgi:type II secretory pathway component PulC
MIHTLSVDHFGPDVTGFSQLPFHEIKKKELDRLQVSEMLTQKWPEIIENIQFIPHIEDGKIHGFEIRNNTHISSLNGLGILEGDIITDVNGIKLNDMFSLFQAFQIVQKNGKFIVGLERNRRPIRYLYTYQ